MSMTGKKSNGDALDLSIGLDDEPPEAPPIGAPFRGMAKEDLLQHSSKPFWRRLRMACISVIILGWLALLITVVALVLIYPRCRAPDSRSWWQREVIYRIYARSFKDSDGDGIGDLKGIESKLNYIQGLGVNAISLCPVYEGDGVDSDFNIKNHMTIDKDYGTMDDFKSLLTAIHDKGMYLILDFIPNHTSDQHPWFVNSSKTSDRSNDLRNFYVWTDNVTNWRSIYNNNSWSLHPDRRQMYLHQFLPTQPDLNLRSSQVKDSLEEVLRFWLSLGVDGFYIRNSGFLFEDYDMRNEERNPNIDNSTQPGDYEYNNHEFTYGLPEVYDMIARWRTLLEEYSNTTERLLIADVRGSIQTVMSYYGHYDRDGVQISLNQNFFNKKDHCSANCAKEYVDHWMTNLPEERWANWMFGDEYTERFATRFNSTYMKPFTMMAMLLPGTPVMFYGDEILLEDYSTVNSEPWQREQTMRGLMRWDNSTDGGFQSCSGPPCSPPWISQSGLPTTENVETQDADAGSVLNFFRNVTDLRKERTFMNGEFSHAVMDESIFSFVREFDGEKGYLVAINFANTEQTRNYHQSHGSIEGSASVVLTTGSDVQYAKDDDIKTNSITLQGYQGIVVTWDYVAKEL